MLDKHTVFILGAGASKPYGFPTARELTDTICHNILEDTSYLMNIRSETNIPPSYYEEMARELKKSRAPSIDLWLGDRLPYLEAGKICIAREIIEKENEERLEETRDWYDEIFHTYLRPDHKDGYKVIPNNRAYFITFNYDRSLEQALCLIFQHNYGLKEIEAAALVNELRILHVYGQLGRLPWQHSSIARTERSYKSFADWGLARKHAADITIFSEATQESPQFETAREWLRRAERIYFLGFGYHSENLARLNAGGISAEVMGSCYQLDGRLADDLQSGNNAFGKRIQLSGRHEGVLEYMKAHVQL